LHNAFETGLAAKGDNEDLFDIKIYEQKELEQLSGYVLKLKVGKSRRFSPKAKKMRPKRAETKLLSQLKKSLAWRYEFGEAPLLPAKSSVTRLTHRSDEYLKIDYSRALDRKPKAVLSADVTGVVEGRLIGTAIHLVISQLDFTGPLNNKAIEKVIDKLLAEGAVTEAVAGRIDTESIITFFHSDLGRLVLDNENTICREWPFTFALPASQWKDSYVLRNTQYAIRNTIIVQGIIDLLVKRPDGLLIIDFKTDRITADQVNQRAELYRRQLDLYSRAASAILKSKLLAKYLYFLTPGCAVEV